MTLSQRSNKASHDSIDFDGLIFLLTLILILVCVSLHFRNVPYRYDETWILSAPQNQPSLTMLPQFIRLWATSFGSEPAITRWLSMLIISPGLVVVSELGRMLYGQRIKWLVLLMTGSFALSTDFGGRVTPYAMAFTFSALLCAMFWVWLRHPQRPYAFAYAISAVLMAITFPTGMVLIILQLVMAAIVFRIQRTRLLLIGIAVIIAIVIGLQGDNIILVIDRSLMYFNPPIRLMIGDNIQVLLLLGLAAAGLAVGWQSDCRSNRYVTWLLGGGLIVSFLVMGTSQMMTIALFLPLILISAARGLLMLMRPVRFLILSGYLLLGFTLVLTDRITIPPYTEMVTQITPSAAIVVSAATTAKQAANLFYIQQQLPEANLFHVVEPTQRNDMQFLPISSSRIASDTTEVDIQQFNDWIQNYTDIRLIEDGTNKINPDLFAQSFKAFSTYTITNWLGERATDKDLQRIVRYVRIPEDLENRFKFGDQIWLQQWTLKSDVNVHACQSINVQSWWGLQQAATTNYSLSLTLVNTSDGQGVTHSDSAVGANETLLWQTKRSYFDERSLTIPCDLATGDYSLLYSVYSLQDNSIHYLAAAQSDDAPLGNQLYLTTLHVQGAS